MAIYKDTKRKTWYFRVYIKDHNEKKVQRQRNGFKTKAEAKSAEYDFLNKMNLTMSNPLEHTKISFQQLYNIYMQDKKQKLKYQSIRTIKNKFENHILPYFKDYDITSITNKDYLDWKDKILTKGFSFKYNSSLHTCMVGILNYAMKFYNLNSNIASKVGNFSKKDYIEKNNFWTYDEFNKFIQVVDILEYYVLFFVLYNTGLRLGEILALDWNHFIIDRIKVDKTLIRGKKNDTYLFNTPKTKTSIREIILDNYTAEALDTLKRYYKNFVGFNENWFIFGGVRPLSSTTIERKKNYYCKKANVKQIRIHDFRHSHATLLLSKKVPITVISKRLGHSNTATTLKIYSHLIPEDEYVATSTLENLYNDNKIRAFQGHEHTIKTKTFENQRFILNMVENKGFEPLTSTVQTWRSSQLS